MIVIKIKKNNKSMINTTIIIKKKSKIKDKNKN
jgi:hypothetical protein